jgi:hypothetical protein
MTTDRYAPIVADNLNRLFSGDVGDLHLRLPARREEGSFRFRAFGEDCVLAPRGIRLGGRPEAGVTGILLSLYALHATPEPMVLEPLRAYREFPGTTPYHGAFATHAEAPLVPRVEGIVAEAGRIAAALDGMQAPTGLGGDAVLLVRPLPKIALCYILYRADEDFPPSVTCLYSHNAHRFLPLDALADVAETTSRALGALP